MKSNFFLMECPFCHKAIFRPLYAWHRATHTQRRPDGQMREHITLHPQGRYQGPLDGVPRAYRHKKCGVATGMPEEIIRSYLVNPFLYGGGSFCCGCNTYVQQNELFWVETGQRLDAYVEQLQQDYVSKYGSPPPKTRV